MFCVTVQYLSWHSRWLIAATKKQLERHKLNSTATSSISRQQFVMSRLNKRLSEDEEECGCFTEMSDTSFLILSHSRESQALV